MTLNGWPFLVTRNRSLDYRTVAAPDFMIDAGVAGILAQETPGEATERPTFRELSGTKVGPITLVYRIQFATDGNERLTDSIGRPIVRVEGFVVKGQRRQLFAENEGIVREQLLQEAHDRVEQNFLEFWNASSVTTSIQRSVAFSTGIEGGREGKPGGKTRRWLLGATTVALLAVVTATLFIICPWCEDTLDFRLTSAGIENSLIQQKYTCDGEGNTLPLQLSGAPKGTSSFALIAEDVTVVSEPIAHWIVYSIPADGTTKEPAKFGTNDFKRLWYEAPCPDEGKTHEYRFTLYAIGGDLNLDQGATKQELRTAMGKVEVLDTAILNVKYTRKTRVK